jgi:hypothetical protein
LVMSGMGLQMQIYLQKETSLLTCQAIYQWTQHDEKTNWIFVNGGRQGSLQSDFIGLRLGGSILAACLISGCVLVGGVTRRRLPCVDFLTGILLSAGWPDYWAV